MDVKGLWVQFTYYCRNLSRIPLLIIEDGRRRFPRNHPLSRLRNEVRSIADGKG